MKHAKRFFLRLADHSARKVNYMRDSKAISYACKEMVMTGMCLGYDMVWDECQLTQERQKINAKHHVNFGGASVTAENAKTESESE